MPYCDWLVLSVTDRISLTITKAVLSTCTPTEQSITAWPWPLTFWFLGQCVRASAMHCVYLQSSVLMAQVILLLQRGVTQTQKVTGSVDRPIHAPIGFCQRRQSDDVENTAQNTNVIQKSGNSVHYSWLIAAVDHVCSVDKLRIVALNGVAEVRRFFRRLGLLATRPAASVFVVCSARHSRYTPVLLPTQSSGLVGRNRGL